MSTIDLTRAKAILQEINCIVARLDGQDLDDSNSQDDPKDREDRQERRRKATLMRELLRMADQLAAIEAIVRNEYWVARGHADIFAGASREETP